MRLFMLPDPSPTSLHTTGMQLAVPTSRNHDRRCRGYVIFPKPGTTVRPRRRCFTINTISVAPVAITD